MPGVLPLPSDDYLGAHIPGAVFFNVNTIADPNDARRICIRAPGSSRATVAALGISSGDTVVAYDSGAWSPPPGVVDVPVVWPIAR